MSLLSQKTEKNKSVIDLEEKVRQDMSKSSPSKRQITVRPGPFGGGGRSG